MLCQECTQCWTHNGRSSRRSSIEGGVVGGVVEEGVVRGIVKGTQGNIQQYVDYNINNKKYLSLCNFFHYYITCTTIDLIHWLFCSTNAFTLNSKVISSEKSWLNNFLLCNKHEKGTKIIVLTLQSLYITILILQAVIYTIYIYTFPTYTFSTVSISLYR